MYFEEIIEKARKKMAEKGMDVLITASLTNVCYCTGHFSKIWAAQRDQLRLVVIPKKGQPFIVTPDTEAKSFEKSGAYKVYVYPVDIYFKYASKEEDLYLQGMENIKDIPEVQNLDVREKHIHTAFYLAAKILKGYGLASSKIGVDLEYVEYGNYTVMRKALPYAEFIDATQIFIDLRAVKTPTEIEYMRKAVDVSEKAIINSSPLLKRGSCILDLHQYYTKEFSKDGCEPDHILISASPIPVGEVFSPMTDEFKDGQVLKIDVGARYHNYGADFARQWVFGDIEPYGQEIFDTICKAVDAMVAILKPGTKISDLYWAGVNVMKELDPDYPRRIFLGHSTGIETHERPYITPYTHDVLVPGMVMCMEVPYYMAGGYAFNVEDEYLITEDGHELLSPQVPRDIVKL